MSSAARSVPLVPHLSSHARRRKVPELSTRTTGGVDEASQPRAVVGPHAHANIIMSHTRIRRQTRGRGIAPGELCSL